LTVAEAIGSFDPAMRVGPGVGLNCGADWFKHDLVLAVRKDFEIIIFLFFFLKNVIYFITR
jgi:hypothetical protein